MAPERRRQIISLVALLAALGVVTYLWWPRPSASASPASNGRVAPDPPKGTVARAAPGQQVPTVHLPDLGAERPKPGAGKRNLFRFKPKPPPPPPIVAPPIVTPPPVPTGPPTPPPPPPITLKFIGTVMDGGKKIAVLTDSTGHPEYGGEGAEIAGRYRILKIGVESLEIAYLDGTGRRTLRLGG